MTRNQVLQPKPASPPLEPKAGIFYSLEAPQGEDVAGQVLVRFQGWAFSRSGRPVTLHVRVANQLRRAILLDQPRPDVAKSFGSAFPVPACCGFGFWLDISEDEAGTLIPVSLDFDDGDQVVRTSIYRLRAPEPLRAAG